MKARERNGESASAARDGRSWNTANDAAVDLPCESVSTLVAMVTGGRARARSDCWRRDETVCFSARASRGSVAFITSGFPRAPRSTPLQSLRAESRTDIRRPGLSRTPEPTSNETKLAKRRDIFAAPLGKGGSHCPPRFGRGSSPPTRRDGVEVGSETRDRGVRRGDARRRRRQRARAPGRSHREQVRRACVTKYTARRIEPARTDVARDRSRRTPTRATRAASRVSRPPTSRRSSADDRAVRSRAPRPEPIARRRSAKSFFVLSRTGRASRPFLAPARERGPRRHQSVGRRFLSCFFFGFRHVFRLSSCLTRPTALKPRRDAPFALTTAFLRSACLTFRTNAHVAPPISKKHHQMRAFPVAPPRGSRGRGGAARLRAVARVRRGRGGPPRAPSRAVPQLVADDDARRHRELEEA